MKDFNIILCTLRDRDLLVKMELQRSLETGEDIDSTDLGTRDRFQYRLTGDTNAYFLKWEGETVGFALIDIARKPYFLKSFFVSRNLLRPGAKDLNLAKLIDKLEAAIKELAEEPVDIHRSAIGAISSSSL